MAKIKNFQSPESSPGLQLSGEKKIWVNSTFLGAANRNSVEVVKKSVKSEAKCHEMAPNFKTSYLRLGRPKSKNFKA